jgi:hypothetical protein
MFVLVLGTQRESSRASDLPSNAPVTRATRFSMPVAREKDDSKIFYPAVGLSTLEDLAVSASSQQAGAPTN